MSMLMTMNAWHCLVSCLLWQVHEGPCLSTLNMLKEGNGGEGLGRKNICLTFSINAVYFFAHIKVLISNNPNFPIRKFDSHAVIGSGFEGCLFNRGFRLPFFSGVNFQLSISALNHCEIHQLNMYIAGTQICDKKINLLKLGSCSSVCTFEVP